MKILENKKITISRSSWANMGLQMGWFDISQSIRLAQISKIDITNNLMISGYNRIFVLADEKLNKIGEDKAKSIIAEAFTKLIKIKKNDAVAQNIMANMMAGKLTNIEVGMDRDNKTHLMPYFNGQAIPYYNELTALVKNISGEHHSFGTINIIPIN